MAGACTSSVRPASLLNFSSVSATEGGDHRAESATNRRAELAEHNWKRSIIRPILAHPWGSAERRVALLGLVGTVAMDWTGKPLTLRESTLELWVRTFEQNDGLHLCLAKKVRKDKGKERVFVSRARQKAVPFDQAIRAQVHKDLKHYMRRPIGGGAQRKQALMLAGEKLREITAAYGVELPAGGPAWRIPLDFYRDERHFQAVYRHKSDRKASDDAKPRIRRTIAGLVPMQVVVMDVHHMNVMVRRENGTAAGPKLIAFHDLATNRVFIELSVNRHGIGTLDRRSRGTPVRMWQGGPDPAQLTGAEPDQAHLASAVEAGIRIGS